MHAQFWVVLAEPMEIKHIYFKDCMSFLLSNDWALTQGSRVFNHCRGCPKEYLLFWEVVSDVMSEVLIIFCFCKKVNDINQILGYCMKWIINTVKYHIWFLYMNKHDSVPAKNETSSHARVNNKGQPLLSSYHMLGTMRSTLIKLISLTVMARLFKK